MKGIEWGSDEYFKLIEQAESESAAQYIVGMMESGASKEEVEKAMDSVR